MKKYFLKNLNEAEISKLCKRPAIEFASVFETVRSVLENVRIGGDEALKKYTSRFDKIELDNFEVSEEEIEEGSARVEEETKAAFKIAASNIEKFHRAEKPERIEVKTSEGVVCFREARPIERIGLYIPGGSAPLPSTVLMLGIPAKIAGCKEIILCTPPGKNGKVADIILFAAKLAGVTKIFKVGGAQAIAAMAYGTETIPRVYKICGPGNQYVTAAKMLLSIDPEGAAMEMPAGPSEVLVIADSNARADFVAADLLSQAEHGPDSQVVLVTDDEAKAEEILEQVTKQLEDLPRKEITAKALEKSFALIVSDLNQALEFANSYAPEHLILNITEAEKFVPQIINAGSVFLGPYSCESAGDYASGTNHTLPTYGYAKAYSGVNTESFMKQITFQTITEEGIKNLGPVIEKMAQSEELFAHKNAATIRNNINNNE